MLETRAGAAGDNLSRRTTSTGVCETSQTEYISKNSNDDKVENSNDIFKNSNIDKEVEEEVGDEEKGGDKVDEMAQLNVKMLFLHNEQVMDGRDCSM